LVDLGHQADGFAEGDDDLVVVGDVRHSRILAVEILRPLPCPRATRRPCANRLKIRRLRWSL
jgi:hypothetical protein